MKQPSCDKFVKVPLDLTSRASPGDTDVPGRIPGDARDQLISVRFSNYSPAEYLYPTTKSNRLLRTLYRSGASVRADLLTTHAPQQHRPSWWHVADHTRSQSGRALEALALRSENSVVGVSAACQENLSPFAAALTRTRGYPEFTVRRNRSSSKLNTSGFSKYTE